jgi:hypothetical protein
VKYAWIDAHRDQFALAELCAVLQVSVSGYRAWKRGGTADRQGLSDTQLLVLIQSIHPESVSSLHWNHCPVSAGMAVHFGPESVLGIPSQIGHRFRRKSATHSGANRPLIPM